MIIVYDHDHSLYVLNNYSFAISDWLRTFNGQLTYYVSRWIIVDDTIMIVEFCKILKTQLDLLTSIHRHIVLCLCVLPVRTGTSSAYKKEDEF